MKKRLIAIASILFVLVLAFSLLAVPASAEERTVVYTNTYSSTTWTLYSDGELVLTGTSSSISSNSSFSSYKPQVTKITFQSSATKIYDYGVFKDYPNLTTVTLSSKIQTIGTNAFQNCPSLETVNLVEGLKTIGSGAFDQCVSLTSIDIPASVTSLSGAFSGCTGLEQINVASGNTKYTSVNGVLFDASKSTLVTYPLGKKDVTSFTIPSSVTKIDANAFSGCTALKSINMTSGSLTIGNYAFNGCTSLESVNINATVTSLGTGAFRDCSSLKSASVKGTYTSIGASTFQNCSALESFAMPSSVTGIGNNAFQNCTALKEAAIPTGVTSIGTYAFDGCAALKSVAVPSGVKSISNYTFRYCSALESVALHDAITTIGTEAFHGCVSLGTIDLPESLTTIGGSAFYGCTELDGIVLPDTLTKIGNFAFYGCTSISDITLPAKLTGNNIGAAAFGRCTSLKEFKVAEANTSICAVDGVLMPKSSQVAIYAYPAGKTDTSYTIPDTVTSVTTYAFSGNAYLKTVTLPTSYTQILANVFEYCTALETVNISNKLSRIGDNAFLGCSSLKNYEVAEGNTYWCDVDGVLFNYTKTTLQAYPAGRTDASYTVPASVTAISKGAFAFSKLSNINFGEAKCIINQKAFYSCDDLETVELPTSVVRLEIEAFANCKNLSAVKVYGTSTEFSYGTTADEVFPDCDPELTLYGHANGKANSYATTKGYNFVAFATSGDIGESIEWSLENGVLTISGTGALPDWNSNTDVPWCDVVAGVKSISVSDGITAIGSNAFYGCINLAEVRLPLGITKVGDSAFKNCSSLVSFIHFNGTAVYGEDVFASCSDSLKIYGRSNSPLQAHAAANEISFTAAYDMGECVQYVTWMLSEDGELSVIGNIAMPNYTAEAPAPWAKYADMIKSVDLTYMLTAGDYAFYNCTKLERIYTCGYFKTVGKYAFAGCTSLQGINWVSPTLPPPQSGQSPKAVMGDSAFEGCTSLKNVSLPSSLSTMGNAAFRGCTALEKIAVYGSVSIGNEAFANCTSLECAKILVSRTAFGTDVFKNVPADFVMYVYTGSTAETYAEDNGHDCVPFISYGRCGENLEWVLYADNELVISGTGEMYDREESYYHTWYSYGYKDSILKITIESGATTIGDYAFFGCSQVKSISIPDTVTSIGDHAFDGCKALTSVDIHKDVTAIGTASFKDCTALTSVNVAEDNENYSDVNGVLYCGTELVCYPAAKKGAEFAVPDDIVSIGGYAFYGCGTLESVTLPKTVQTVAAGNFAQCEALVKVVILNKEIAIDGVMSGNEALAIYGFAGSTAETYANANSIAFVAIADEITNVNVTVGTDLTLNYYAKIWDSESEKLVVTADNKEFEIEGVYDEAVGLYKFSLFGLPPQGMTTLISAKLVRGEEELDVLADFSIRQYLDMLLATKPDGMSDEKYDGLKTLIADMLEYGAAAQEYTGYATDSMANADVDGASSFVAPEANITSSVKTEVTGAEIVAVGVRFDYANKIFYHIVTDDISKVTLEVSGLTLTADDFEKIGSNKYIAYSGDILATQLDDKVTAVLKVDGQTAQTVDYSVASYVYVMHGETNEGEPTAMATLCMRLYTYGRSAAAYAAMN